MPGVRYGAAVTDLSPEFTSEVPIWPALIVPVLTVLAGGGTLYRNDLFDKAADEAQLSQPARRERLATGGLRYEQRMGWVLSNGTHAGLIERPARGHYAITDIGRVWLVEHPNGMDYSQARQFFKPFWPEARAKSSATDVTQLDALQTLEPVEQIEDGIERIRADVAERLLERLRSSHPAFFERAVVTLLLKMGYGGAEERGRHLGGSNDGGVDGVIDEDALGLDRIYIEAKRYQVGSNISRETIQAFVGALAGVGASKGVFITTSDFTPGAREYVANISARIILIDSSRLTNLMIDYGVGVQSRSTYTVVDLDEDFFD
jgi:restriction system protein